MDIMLVTHHGTICKYNHKGTSLILCMLYVPNVVTNVIVFMPLTLLSNCKRDEEVNSDDSGVEGILRRIEKQRSLAKDRKGYDQSSYDKRELDTGEGGKLFVTFN